jgi:Protein of Unknown function (DUF2784)
MHYRVLVPAIVLSHFGYLAYLVLGGFLTWWWPAAIWPHLVATGWAVLIVACSLSCPLTAAERWARRGAGQQIPTRGFMDRYVENVIYPARYTNQVRLGCAVIVVGSWLLGIAH